MIASCDLIHAFEKFKASVNARAERDRRLSTISPELGQADMIRPSVVRADSTQWLHRKSLH